MHNFTPIESLIGGLLIGVAAALMLVFRGRIAGISGITGELLTPGSDKLGWRAQFVIGMIATGAVLALLTPDRFAFTIDRPIGVLVAAGLLVGFGTRLGSGCTSGHGVCGIGRLSPRSLIATVTFVGTAIATVYVFSLLGGGS